MANMNGFLPAGTANYNAHMARARKAASMGMANAKPNSKQKVM